MTPQQYERLTELFHAALEIAPDERAAFLDRVSEGDAELRRELESLLIAHEQRAGYAEKPPDDIAAGMYLAQKDNGGAAAASLPPNTRIDRYEIRSLLGKGGMGEVYLAEDTILRRLVALKVLPAVATANEDRMRRFIQEATTAAALSHPHIAQIFEVGEYEGTHFIAMELVDGVTLREKIHSERTNLRKLLKYLQQVAEGLAKAHAAGIVHRDLKPDNIMITRDDYAKILDFGLAKLVEVDRSSGLGGPSSSEVGTRIMAQQSVAGMVMGTAGYMSPEQAQGKVEEIDQRSDIFSFGCILFEAVTGQKPFEGEDILDSLHKIVHAPTPQIKETNADAPPELQRIVRRCLAKDPDERYQTIKDVALELKEVREGMAGPAEIETTVPPSGRTETLGPQPSAQSTTSISSAEYLVSQIKSHKRSAAIALAALVIAAAVLAYFFYFKPKRSPALTQQDTILLADFFNTTGDPLLDGTLKTGLAVQLEQSPYLNLLSDERVREMLRYMERKPDERVTKEVAREICERQGLKAFLAGTVSKLGSHYVIALEAINAHTGDLIARQQEEAESQEQLLRTLGQAATKLREKLGESLSSIQKYDAPIEQATTTSLEALKAYSLAREAALKGNYRESIKHANRALELDPNFLVANQLQGGNYGFLGQSELSIQFATKAFELRNRGTEYERLAVSSGYYWQITGELDKATETLEYMTQTYPRSSAAHNNLAGLYGSSGHPEKAIEEYREAIRLNPIAAIPYYNLAFALNHLNRFAEAKEVLNQALARKLDIPLYHRELYGIAFINGDSAEMKKHIDWASARPGEFVHLDWQSWSAAFAGQARQARAFSSRAFDAAEDRNAREDAARTAITQALNDAVFGNCQQVKESTAKGIALAHTALNLWNAALALAACGEVGRTQALVDECAKRFPKDTLGAVMSLPTIRATIELRRNNPAQAIVLLEGTKQYEAFWPPYTRGQAYLKLRKGAEAAAEFQKILDHRGWDPLSPLYPLAHLGLGRAAVLSNDTAKARQAYQDFLALWKDADPDLPVLLEAKKEYEKLK
jgi:serine/threonine protein kinase/Flp pilus assembly protein TadD